MTACVVCGGRMEGAFAPVNIVDKDIIFYCSDRCYEKDDLPPEKHPERAQNVMFEI